MRYSMNFANEMLVSELEIDNRNGAKPDFFSQIKSIDEIARQAGGINDLFDEFAQPHLQFLGKHLKTSQTGTALLAILVNLYNGDRISITKLAEYLHCKIIDVMSYFD